VANPKAGKALALLLAGASVFTACQGRSSPTAPAGTPTPASATVIRLRAVRWAWQWVQGPGANPASPSPEITLKTGQTYEIHVFNGDIPDDVYLPHQFSGIFGWIPGSQLPYNAPDYVVTVVAPAPGTYGFSCLQFQCGPTAQHEGMIGSIVVTP